MACWRVTLYRRVQGVLERDNVLYFGTKYIDWNTIANGGLS